MTQIAKFGVIFYFAYRTLSPISISDFPDTHNGNLTGLFKLRWPFLRSRLLFLVAIYGILMVHLAVAPQHLNQDEFKTTQETSIPRFESRKVRSERDAEA